MFSCTVVTASLWPIDYYRSPGSSVYGISQARMPAWVVIPIPRVSSLAKDGTRVSCIGRQILYHWATREALPYFVIIERKLNSVSIYWKQQCNIFFLSNFTGHLGFFLFCFVFYFSPYVKGIFSWLWNCLE